MGQIQEGDFSISYKGNDAHVYHFPTKQEFVGNGFDDRFENLILALTAMEHKVDNGKFQ